MAIAETKFYTATCDGCGYVLNSEEFSRNRCHTRSAPMIFKTEKEAQVTVRKAGWYYHQSRRCASGPALMCYGCQPK